MNRQAIPVARILGIPIGLDYSWFLIFALLTWILAASYYPAEFHRWPPWLYWLMGAATAILFFLSILLHELGHSVVALRYKVPVRSITLFVFGGVATIGGEPPSARAEFLIAIAGPLVSFVLGLLFYALQPAFAASEPLLGLSRYLTYINFGVALFNLVPGYPLDGGRVFRAIVWAVTHDMRRATLVAANAGRFFGFSLILIGAWQIFAGNFGGVWIAFVGWFLDAAATAQARQVVVQDLLAGHTVAQVMSNRCATVSADLPLQQLADEHILGRGQRCFLVNRGDTTVGLITPHRLNTVPRSEWTGATAAQVMMSLEQSKRVAPETELSVALQLMDRDGVNQLPVMALDRVVGMLTREDVITFLRTLQELGAWRAREQRGK
jgi:Zn-dependent protease/predicted transcriptional regulator